MGPTDETLTDADESHADDVLELFTEDGEEWTALPPEPANDRASRWITGDLESLCDLEEWR